MDKTPKLHNRLSCRSARMKQKEASSPNMFDGSPMSTPTQSKLLNRTNPEADYSPVFIPSTQEAREDVDVVWDWNSPQSKTTFLLKQKRLHLAHSPKPVLKRHPSKNQLPDFSRLKVELEELRNDIADEGGQQNKCNRSLEFGGLAAPIEEDDLSKIFEDESIDLQLLIASQAADIVTKAEVPHVSNTIAFDDSIDFATFKDEDFDMLTQPSPPKVPPVILCSPDMIEKKRLQALQKLEARKLQDIEARNRKEAMKRRENGHYKSNLTASIEQTSEETSPIKCSPEEVEQKRRQALAKLEARRQLDIVERKKQEALKRLEMTKRKRMLAKQKSM